MGRCGFWEVEFFRWVVFEVIVATRIEDSLFEWSCIMERGLSGCSDLLRFLKTTPDAVTEPPSPGVLLFKAVAVLTVVETFDDGVFVGVLVVAGLDTVFLGDFDSQGELKTFFSLAERALAGRKSCTKQLLEPLLLTSRTDCGRKLGIFILASSALGTGR